MQAFCLSVITALVIFVGFWLDGLVGITFLAAGAVLLLFSYLKHKKNPRKKTKTILCFSLALLIAGIFMCVVEHFVIP